MILGTDVSFYETSDEEQIDFEKMKSAGVKFCVIRAGQNLWPDPTCKRNISECKRLGIPYSSYWFYDSRIEPKRQAELWKTTIGNDLGQLPLFFDAEESYNGPYKGSKNWIIFIDHFKTLVGNHEIGLYTGYYYFKDNCSTLDKPYFKDFSLWMADYDSMPQIPSPLTKLEFWQFSEKGDGSIYGTPGGSVDLNYYMGTEEEFNTRFGINATPEIKHIYTRRFESDIHTVTVLKGTKTQIYYTGSRTTVLAMAQKTGAIVAVNGGDYNPYTGKPVGVLAVDGLVRSGFEEYMPWLNATATNEMQINTFDAKETPYNAVAGRRILVVDGKQSDKTSAAWLEVHPKTFFGVSANGDLIIITADGRTDKSRGVNLYEGAQLLIEAGAVRGFDGGGGGDTTLVIDGKVTNVPIADTTPGELRPVADGVLIFGTISSEQPPEGGNSQMKYKVVVPIKPRKSPSMYETVTKSELPVGYEFDSNVVKTVVERIPAGGPSYTIEFIQLPDTYYVPKYLAYVGTGGTTYVVENTVIPPPTTDPNKPTKVTVENAGGTYVATEFTKLP